MLSTQQTTYENIILIFPRKQVLTVDANCLFGDNEHKMPKPVSWEK